MFVRCGGGDRGGGLERGGTGATKLELRRIVEATGGTAGWQRRGTRATKLHAIGVLKVTARTVHGSPSLMLVRWAGARARSHRRSSFVLYALPHVTLQ
jgi:hypothetical protein